MCYNGKEVKKNSDPSVNATSIEAPDRRLAPVMITLKNGSQSFQREDGNSTSEDQVLQVSEAR
jgi:hypothetical protein